LVEATLPSNTADGGFNYRATQWLGLKHAISVLPSISTLRALRGLHKSSAATKPYLAFGNPLLDGSENDKLRAQEARDKQSCQTDYLLAKLGQGNKALLADPQGQQLHDGLADPIKIRAQRPLPESRDELCEVSASLGGGTDDVYLGMRATEEAIKSLSEQKALRNYRVVHFSTHGLLATETENIFNLSGDPALILTPPDRATERDDGLLTASEIAMLDFDADWIILSACNTAAGAKDDPDSYSGLGRAFFYAGARAILASHWYVDAAASKILISKAFDKLREARPTRRAERLQHAMRYMITEYEDPLAAHPEYWAPFVVVGEGAE
jgi:CHAT domain-containing protein